MKSVLLSIVLNTLCFGLTYMMMPSISPLEFLELVILVPVIFNVMLFLKGDKIAGNSFLTISILTIITTASYALFGLLTTMNGAMSAFAERNSYSDGNVTIAINENSNSFSNILFIILIQGCVMFFVKFMQDRRLKSDTCK